MSLEVRYLLVHSDKPRLVVARPQDSSSLRAGLLCKWNRVPTPLTLFHQGFKLFWVVGHGITEGGTLCQR